MSEPVRHPAYPRQDGLTAMSALQEDEDFLQSIWTGADGEIPIESSEDASSSYFSPLRCPSTSPLSAPFPTPLCPLRTGSQACQLLAKQGQRPKKAPRA